MQWSAAQYAKFLGDRTRPARDLLAAVPLETPGLVADIGCGPGNSTALLAERFPGAQIVGLDPDADMIRTAQAALSGCRFVQGDVESWRPEAPPELIFANASLQWVPDHRALLPHLVGLLRPGGVLASSDLSFDTRTSEYEALLRTWLNVMLGAGLPASGLEQIRATYANDVAILPPPQVADIIKTAGFDEVVPFYQAGLIHAWFSRRA